MPIPERRITIPSLQRVRTLTIGQIRRQLPSRPAAFPKLNESRRLSLFCALRAKCSIKNRRTTAAQSYR